MSSEHPTTDSPNSRPDTLTFFNNVYVAYREAAEKEGQAEYTYRLGDNTIRLCFAGGALVPVLTPALEHLRTPAVGPADFTVYLWDVNSTGVPLPHRPWDWPDNPARGDVHSLSDARFQVAYNQFANLLSLLDREENVAFCCVADVSESGIYMGAVPLLDILHWWLQQRGLQAVHAGAVGISTGGVLLVGKGGSGKSTTTLSCLRSRLRIAGDDYCLISTRGEPYVYGLYSAVRMEVANLARLPHLRPLVSNPAALDGGGDKATIFLQQHYPDKLIKRFPLRAILVPRITGEPQTYLRPTSRMEGFRALTVNTIEQRAGAGKGAFDGIANVIKQVPCYTLMLGTDMSQLANVLEDFVSSAPQPNSVKP